MKRIAFASVFLFLLLGKCPAQSTHSEFNTDDSTALAESGLEKAANYKTNYSFFWGGYIRGIAEALVGDGIVCIPDGVSNEETQRVVMKYLSDNPTTLHKHALATVGFALKQSYPCKK